MSSTLKCATIYLPSQKRTANKMICLIDSVAVPVVPRQAVPIRVFFFAANKNEDNNKAALPSSNNNQLTSYLDSFQKTRKRSRNISILSYKKQNVLIFLFFCKFNTHFVGKFGHFYSFTANKMLKRFLNKE